MDSEDMKSENNASYNLNYRLTRINFSGSFGQNIHDLLRINSTSTFVPYIEYNGRNCLVPMCLIFVIYSSSIRPLEFGFRIDIHLYRNRNVRSAKGRKPFREPDEKKSKQKSDTPCISRCSEEIRCRRICPWGRSYSRTWNRKPWQAPARIHDTTAGSWCSSVPTQNPAAVCNVNDVNHGIIKTKINEKNTG